MYARYMRRRCSLTDNRTLWSSMPDTTSATYGVSSSSCQCAANQNSICPIEASGAGRQNVIRGGVRVDCLLDLRDAAAGEKIADKQTGKGSSISGGVSRRGKEFPAIGKFEMHHAVADWHEYPHHLEHNSLNAIAASGRRPHRHPDPHLSGRW